MMSGATGSIASLSVLSLEYAEKLYTASKKLIGQGAAGIATSTTSSSNDSNYTRYSTTAHRLYDFALNLDK